MSEVTLTILIGNSDDKLSQSEWSDYVSDVSNSITGVSEVIEFQGTSRGDAPWQNACWVARLDDKFLSHLRLALSDSAEEYRQDSIAVLYGTVEFWGLNP